MRSLSKFISERFGDHFKSTYNYHPKDYKELKRLIDKLLIERGNECELE